MNVVSHYAEYRIEIYFLRHKLLLINKVSEILKEYQFDDKVRASSRPVN